MLESVIADKYRWKDYKHPIILSQFRFIYVKRWCEYYRNRSKVLFFVWRAIYQRMETKYNMDFPAKVIVGKGLRIEHMGGVVINPNAILGENITLLNGVLIGSQSRGSKKGYPVIGNDVWIGTNAVIVGSIKIGDHVLIAPGAYINFDVPECSIVLGNPGQIIHRENATKGYTLNLYE